MKNCLNYIVLIIPRERRGGRGQLQRRPQVTCTQFKVQSSKFFIPIKGPEGQTDSTATYTFIIKTHSIEQFNQNEITLQDCGIIIIYSVYIFFYNYYYTSSNMYKPRQSTE